MIANFDSHECHHKYITMGSTTLCEKCGMIYEMQKQKHVLRINKPRPIPKHKPRWRK